MDQTYIKDNSEYHTNQIQDIPSLIVNLIGVNESHKFKSPDAQPWKLFD